MTTAGCAGALYSMVRSSVRCVMTVHTEAKDVGPEMRRHMLFAAERLPKEWTGGVRKIGGVIEFRKTGSIWICVTAGHTEQVADSVTRSGGVDVLHMTEAKRYSHAADLFAAAKEAVPRTTGSILCETTFPTLKSHWVMQQYLATRQDRGNFLRAFFFEWYLDPRKRIGKDDPEFRQVMSSEFAATMAPEDLEAEDRLALDDQQIAWRRANYCKFGTSKDRRLARLENPEDDQTPFLIAHTSWLAESALDVVDARTRAPEVKHWLSSLYGVSIWRLNPAGLVVYAADTAEKTGVDYMSCVGVEQATRDQVAEAHGRALDSEFAEAIAWMVARVHGSVGSRAYTVCVERNRGKRLIAELQKRGVRLWAETRGGKPGVTTSRYNRDAMLACVLEAVQGPAEDEDGADRSPSPIVDVGSKFLAAELRGLALVESKRGIRVEGKGEHDDLAMAYAIALFVCGLVKVSYSGPIPKQPRVRVNQQQQLAALDRRVRDRGLE